MVPVRRVGTEESRLVNNFESSVILEYLEETTSAPGLYPADALERARHREWIEFASACIFDHVRVVMASSDAERDAALADLTAKLTRLEDVVRGPYFGGSAFSLVDAAFAPLFRAIGILEGLGLVRHPVLPRVDGWRSALLDRDSVREAASSDFEGAYRGWAGL